MPPRRPALSVLVAILGDYSRVREAVSQLARELLAGDGARGGVEVVLLCRGGAWRRELPWAALAASGVKTRVIETAEELPAAVFNQGARMADGAYLAFAWPGVDVAALLACARRLAGELALRPGAGFAAGRPPAPDAAPEGVARSWIPREAGVAPPGFEGGWLEMLDYVPMQGAAVEREFFLAQGGFSCCPLLRRGFWWEFTIRTGRKTPIDAVDVTPPAARWSWWDFPLERELPLSGDLVARRALRSRETPPAVSTAADYDAAESFLRDLPAGLKRRVRRGLEHWMPEGTVPRHGVDAEAGKPLRVTVLGGLNEPAHNQLCFYGYFSLLEGQGVLSWRGILDSAASYMDLDKSDLVIFSRSRTEPACRLMDFCVAQGIPTVYMLDDNWLSIGKEWPEYAGMFTPGAAPWENFQYCLARATRVLTYNDLLAEDLRRFHSRVEVLPTNIDLGLFERETGAPREKLRVGYAGSFRREDSAFRGLRELAGERDDFDVFVMSGSVPEALQSLPRARLLYQPYVFGYRRYAKVLCEARPDVLLAPLASTRTDASKCPNKYLENAAVGAAGIYSKTAPYTRFLRDGENGLLVENDAAHWKRAIARLLDDASLRGRIVRSAEADVRTRFSTPAVLPEFLGFLKRAVTMWPE